MKRIKVLVVEDDAFTRSTLVATLEYEGFEVPGAADGAASAIASFNRFSHDALLADLDLGLGPNGLELAWLLRKTKPKLGVVLLTSFEDPRLHRKEIDALPHGARYLIKQDLADRSQISQALSHAVNETAGAPQTTTRQHNPESINLTNIQVQTLRMVAEGKSNSEIAQHRFISEKAVEQNIRRLAAKLGLKDSKNQRVALTKTYYRLTGGKG